MVSINGTKDTVIMMVVAAVVGALAGLGAYALQSKKEADKEAFLGKATSMLVGGLASVGILYFISPISNLDVNVKGTVKMTSQYDLLKLVSLSAIVGSAGRAFLTSLQGRVGAALSQQTSSNVVAEAPKAVAAAKSQIEGEVEQAQAAVKPVIKELQKLSSGPVTPEQVAKAAHKLNDAQREISKVADQLDTHLNGVTERINAAAGQPVGSPASSEQPAPDAQGNEQGKK